TIKVDNFTARLFNIYRQVQHEHHPQGEKGDKTVAIALANPDRYVLKPQREEGANNIYGSEICEVLENLKNSTKRTAYILMDKIQPVPVQN
ncbi:hypothetical protein cypCar_00023256, partial [Cyprinus carpio]